MSTSTSEAAAQVARGEIDAAVCAPLAADQFGLEIIADDVADNAGAVTRFVLVAPPGPPPAPTGHDRTTLAATTQNRPDRVRFLGSYPRAAGGNGAASGVGAPAVPEHGTDAAAFAASERWLAGLRSGGSV